MRTFLYSLFFNVLLLSLFSLNLFAQKTITNSGYDVGTSSYRGYYGETVPDLGETAVRQDRCNSPVFTGELDLCESTGFSWDALLIGPSLDGFTVTVRYLGNEESAILSTTSISEEDLDAILPLPSEEDNIPSELSASFVPDYNGIENLSQEHYVVYIQPRFDLSTTMAPVGGSFSPPCSELTIDPLANSLVCVYMGCPEVEVTGSSSGGGTTSSQQTSMPVGGSSGFAPLDVLCKRGRQTNLPASTLSIAPNPIQQQANILITLPTSSKISVSIYNTNGQQIDQLITGEQMAKGEHNVNYNAGHLPAGVYYCHIRSNEGILTKKVVKY